MTHVAAISNFCTNYPHCVCVHGINLSTRSLSEWGQILVISNWQLSIEILFSTSLFDVDVKRLIDSDLHCVNSANLFIFLWLSGIAVVFKATSWRMFFFFFFQIQCPQLFWVQHQCHKYKGNNLHQHDFEDVPVRQNPMVQPFWHSTVLTYCTRLLR